MLKKGMIVPGTLLAAASFCFAQGTTEKKTEVKKVVIKQTSASSGKEMFTQYCAPCHGVDGTGNGPAAPAMKSQPTNLTQLAKKRDGKYPANTVAGVLKFGSGGGTNPAHGSADMPIWGPLFLSLDEYHDSAVQQRISNIVTYIETLQAK
jgi:mono/diheme cytochrome c family protein